MRHVFISFVLSILMTAATLARTAAPEEPVGMHFPPEVAEWPTHPQAALIDSVLVSLDLRARVGQLIVVYRTDNETLLEGEFGGVLLFSNMLVDTVALRGDLDALQTAAPVPLLVCLDQEGGNVSRLDTAPGFESGTPGAVAMGGWTPQEVYAEGARIGEVLAALGVTVNLAPVLDSSVTWDDRESWMGHRERAFGATTGDIVPPAMAFAKGCRQAGVVCIGKHYPGYDVAGDTDRELQISGADLDQLASGEARFFKARDAVAGVMMSSVICTALTDRPAVLEERLVARAHFSPSHVVMTDDLWSLALRRWVRPDLEVDWKDFPADAWAELGKAALWAGNDLLLVTYPEKAGDLRDALVALAEQEGWAREAVDRAAIRVLGLKADLGLLSGN